MSESNEQEEEKCTHPPNKIRYVGSPLVDYVCGFCGDELDKEDVEYGDE